MEVALSYAAPLGPGEKTNSLQIAGFQFDLKPLGVRWQFAPHGASPQEEQRTPQSILPGTAQVRVNNQPPELSPVFLKLGVVKFTPQEFRNHLFLSQAAQQTKTAVAAKDLRSQLLPDQRNHKQHQQDNHQQQLDHDYLMEGVVESIYSQRECGAERELHPAGICDLPGHFISDNHRA